MNLKNSFLFLIVTGESSTKVMPNIHFVMIKIVFWHLAVEFYVAMS